MTLLMLYCLVACNLVSQVRGVCKKDTLTPAEQLAVDEHNKLRREHKNTLDLCYAESGDDATFTSQAWAEELATFGELRYSKGEHGENIANKITLGNLSPDILTSYNTSIHKWYGEIKDWSFTKNAAVSSSKVVRHFTQVVWRDTSQVNCGHATSVSQTGSGITYYVVCQYYVAGNKGNVEEFGKQVAVLINGVSPNVSASLMIVVSILAYVLL